MNNYANLSLDYLEEKITVDTLEEYMPHLKLLNDLGRDIEIRSTASLLEKRNKTGTSIRGIINESAKRSNVIKLKGALNSVMNDEETDTEIKLDSGFTEDIYELPDEADLSGTQFTSKLIGKIEVPAYLSITGRPGEYKTTIGGKILNEFAEAGFKVCMASLEMPPILLKSKFPIENVKFISKNYLASKVKLKAAIRKSAKNMDVILIDHLQLLPHGANTYAELTEWSRFFQSIMRTTGTTIILLAQMSRRIEKQKSLGIDRLPTLSDIMDTDAIGQDSTMVVSVEKLGRLTCRVTTLKDRFSEGLSSKTVKITMEEEEKK